MLTKYNDYEKEILLPVIHLVFNYHDFFFLFLFYIDYLRF